MVVWKRSGPSFANLGIMMLWRLGTIFWHPRTSFIVLLFIERCRLNLTPNCKTELSPKGYQFLTELFRVHDKVSQMCLYDSISPLIRIRTVRWIPRSWKSSLSYHLVTHGNRLRLMQHMPLSPMKKGQLPFRVSWRYGARRRCWIAHWLSRILLISAVMTSLLQSKLSDHGAR